MRVIAKSPSLLLLATFAVAGTVPASLAAQPQDPPLSDLSVSVGEQPYYDAAEMTEGPEIDGIITSRSGDLMQVTSPDGISTTIAISGDTRVTASGGFLGLGRTALAADALLNGLPVSVRTWQSGSGLTARRIDLKNRDLRTATMIHSGTAQQFAEQTAATDALRDRVGSIDQYNVRSTTNVNFDFGRANLSEHAKAELCATAASAEATENALLLVVGYTDSIGSAEVNQALSERRAGSVVNHLQQVCGWQPYRMLTPTGMAMADPVASNDTAEGQAQNRRVAVSILVSKAVDGL